MADRVRAEVGHPTVVINNAGVMRGKKILEAEPADVRFTFDVNALAPFWVARAFVPHMAARDHGMFVTVASYASWMPVTGAVDYCASKAAALAFHEGLTTELTTVHKAPRVRTVVVHPAHTRTQLADGWDQGTAFSVPELLPETIADAVVRKVLSGTSGSIILPESGALLLPLLRALPDWFQVRARARTLPMKNWKGYDVMKDIAAPYDDRSSQGDVGESTVLVSSQQTE